MKKLYSKRPLPERPYNLYFTLIVSPKRILLNLRVCEGISVNRLSCVGIYARGPIKSSVIGLQTVAYFISDTGWYVNNGRRNPPVFFYPRKMKTPFRGSILPHGNGVFCRFIAVSLFSRWDADISAGWAQSSPPPQYGARTCRPRRRDSAT